MSSAEISIFNTLQLPNKELTQMNKFYFFTFWKRDNLKRMINKNI